MNVSRVAGHGFSNHAPHFSGRLENVTVNVQDNNLQNVATLFDDSATKVSISPEAEAQKIRDEKHKDYMDRNTLVFNWLREIQAEAYKNGTSMKAACRKYGREIAEDLVDKKLDNPSEETLKKRDALKRHRGDYEISEETLNRFFEGITRYMAGESYKNAFNLNEQDPDYPYYEAVHRDDDFLSDYLNERDNWSSSLHMKGVRGGIFSHRYEDWIYEQDKIKPDEEDFPKIKNNDEAAPQDKKEIFKDFAEQIIASHHKKKNKTSYANFFEKTNHARNAIKNPKIKNEDSELAAKFKNIDESFASRVQESRARKDAVIVENPWMAAPVPSCIEAAAHISIHNALDGKVENSTDVSAQLINMLFNKDSNSDLETRATDRKAAKKLAEHIAENYLTEPKEKQAFLNIINKLAEISELLDKGYEIPSQSFVNSEDKIAEWAKLTDEERNSYAASAIMDIKPIKPLPQNETQIQSLIEYSDEKRARDELLKPYRNPALAGKIQETPKFNIPKSYTDEADWEKWKELLCNEKFATYQAEQNKAWYADFSKNLQAATDAIDKAKSVKDFSSNKKWNVVMNLLS